MTYEVRVSHRGLVAEHIPNTTGLTEEGAEALATSIRSEYKEYFHITVEVVEEVPAWPTCTPFCVICEDDHHQEGVTR